MSSNQNTESQVTEIIMALFLGVTNDGEIYLQKQDYNKIYSKVYEILSDLQLSKILRENYNIIQNHKHEISEKYKHKTDFLKKRFPNGIYTKNENGELVGINIAMNKIVKELCELNEL